MFNNGKYDITTDVEINFFDLTMTLLLHMIFSLINDLSSTEIPALKLWLGIN
jgi:hypothetical protein